MGKSNWILVFLLVLIGCKSQNLPEKNSEFSASPVLMLKSESSVVQDYSVEIRINSIENATYHTRKVVTILGPDARGLGKLMLPYDRFRDILNVEGAIYSKSGNLIRRLTEDDAMDLSLSGGYTLYQDSRLKIYELYYDAYPYTVVYDYEIALDGLLNLPAFYPQSRNQFVENARLEVHVPKNINLKFHSSNINKPVLKKANEQDSVFTWQLQNFEPMEREPYAHSFSEVTPKILLTAESFEVAGTEGRMDSWNSFGQWYYSLAKNRNELPETVKNEVENIYANAGNRKNAIKDLYKYMQNKTRYVSIQLGLGGWQPYDAMFVEEKGYGDCKALTNYMQAILNHVGIDAYPVLINSGLGDSEIVADFPSNQFNHVILWVPGSDTIWLESTSQTIPFNYIGQSNSDRYGLAITPDSSFLVKTPEYDYHSNWVNEEANLRLDENGKAAINIRKSYSGYYIDQLYGNLADKSKAGQINWTYEHLPFDSFVINKVNFSDIDKRKKNPVLSFDIFDVGYATKTGSRLFIPVNKLNRWEEKFPAMNRTRTEDIHLPFSFRENNTTTIELPKGYVIEALPESIELTTDFSRYRLNIENTNIENEIEISRVLEISEEQLPAETYVELRKFFLAVERYDSKNIVLRESG